MAEASALVPYSAEYLSLLARKKKLSAKKVGKTWYTTKAILDEYMKRQMMRNQIQNGDISSLKEMVEPAAAPVAADVSSIASAVSEAAAEASASAHDRGDMILFSKRPVEDHPETKRVRTFHEDLKNYLSAINSGHVPAAPKLAVPARPTVAPAQQAAPVRAAAPVRPVVEVPQEHKAMHALTSFLEKTHAPSMIHDAPAVEAAPIRPAVTAAARKVAQAPAPQANLDVIAATLSEIAAKLEKIADGKAAVAGAGIPSGYKVIPGQPNIVS